MKKEQVADMFTHIARRYDFLNHFFSMGIDIIWRKKTISMLKQLKPQYILDVATGTGDLAIEALSLNPVHVTGVDISEGMLAIGRIKIKKKGLEGKITLIKGDSEKLLFEDNKFDAVTVAFGVRNFERLEKGLADMFRVLKPGGVAVILEFSKPGTFPVKQLYNVYFNRILPLLGKIISKNDAAYTYLPESVSAFPCGKEFVKHLDKAGFTNVVFRPLTFGIATVYVGKKEK